MISLIIVAFAVSIVSSQSTYECHDDYSCVLSSLSDSSTSESDIECYGYNACSQCTKIESTAAALIYCHGAFSCYDTDLIQHTGTTYAAIYCKF